MSDLISHGSSSEEAKCMLCKCVIKLSNMGKLHCRTMLFSKKQRQKLKGMLQIKKVFDPKIPNRGNEKPPSLNPSKASSGNVELVSSVSQPLFSRISSQKAEILWALKYVLCGFSDHSCKKTVDLFKKMFPDSKVVKKMQLEPSKLKCIINHGIGPYVQEILKDVVRGAVWFVISFDEYLDEIAQASEMDLCIRFWNNEKCQVEDRCWCSVFLGPTTHMDIFEAFQNGIKAFQFESTGWNMKQVMKGCFQLLKDSPALHVNFISITGSNKEVPLQFCATTFEYFKISTI